MSHLPAYRLAAVLVIGAATMTAFAQEPRQGGPGGREGRGGFPMLPIVAALDADGDGELSTKEIDNAAVALRTLDKNKDGKLTRDEMLPAFRGPGGPGGPGGAGGPNPAEMVNRLMSFDKNGDGKLSKDELPERMQGLMDRADANKDGFVDRAELTRQAQQQQGGRGRGFGGPGEGRGGFGPGEGRRRPDGPGTDR